MSSSKVAFEYMQMPLEFARPYNQLAHRESLRTWSETQSREIEAEHGLRLTEQEARHRPGWICSEDGHRCPAQLGGRRKHQTVPPLRLIKGIRSCSSRTEPARAKIRTSQEGCDRPALNSGCARRESFPAFARQKYVSHLVLDDHVNWLRRDETYS